MKTFAIVDESGLVTNCIISETYETADLIAKGDNENYSVVEYFIVEPGWSYDDGQWVKPTE